jgi:hypothetical protein
MVLATFGRLWTGSLCRARPATHPNHLCIPMGVFLLHIKKCKLNIYSISQSIATYHLDKLRSTRRAKRAIKNKIPKAIETALGFCRCADSGTLYVTYSTLSEIAQMSLIKLT